MAATDLAPAYLIVGSDRPKVARALERLRARVGEQAVETLTARETAGAEAVAALNSLGLFGGTRLVLVEEGERWKAADVKAVASYLDAPAPDTVCRSRRAARRSWADPLTRRGTSRRRCR